MPSAVLLQAATALRGLWRDKHESHEYPEFKAEWDRVLYIFSCSCPLLPPTSPGAPPTPALPATALPTPTGSVEAMQID